MKLKDFLAMECPVCSKWDFKEDLDDIMENPEEYYIPETCNWCGWVYDLKQTQNPNLKNGENKMSLNEYKKWYLEKISKNPDYSYL